MVGFLLLLIFAVFAGLMFARVMPAILAIPAMAISVAGLVGLPLPNILNDVVAAGAVKLAPAYTAVFAGAMLGRVMIETGIAEGIIKRAAEFGGENPGVVAGVLMCVTALLFTTQTGLGSIIMVGTLVLPIMMSLGLSRKLAATLFLMGYATGHVFNIATWQFYGDLLQIAATRDPQVPRFATGLLVITATAVALYTVVMTRRASELSFWAVASKDDLLEQRDDGKQGVPLVSFLTPLVPLLLVIGFKWAALPAFIGGALFGVLTAAPRDSVRILSRALVRGVEDGAPAAILFAGIGMLLNALTLPTVKGALAPVVALLPLGSPIVYVLFFGLLSPLALYRGPLNPYGVGIGVYSIMFATGVLPPLALFAAILSIVQVQNVCDPTNTHNVWVANFTGVPVEDLTKRTLLTMMVACFGGLVLGAWMFLR